MVKLMQWDVSGIVPEELYTPEQMQDARNLIQEEIEKVPSLDANMWKVLNECSSELIRYQGRYTRLSNLGRKEQAEALTNKFRVSFFGNFPHSPDEFLILLHSSAPVKCHFVCLLKIMLMCPVLPLWFAEIEFSSATTKIDITRRLLTC
jgi:hypothetical protein